MKDLLLSARRGIEALVDPKVAIALFGTGLLWTAVNALLGWLLLGPALVVLFRISLVALRGQEPDIRRDNLAALEDLPASLVVGILFALPFKLWLVLDQLCAVARMMQSFIVPGVPAIASAALFIHFAFHILAFPVIADRHCGGIEAAERSRELAELPGRGGSRLQGFGRHVLFTSVVLAVLLLATAWYWRREAGWLFTTIVGPPAVMLLSAWYLQLTGSPARDEEVPGQRAEIAEMSDAPELEDER